MTREGHQIRTPIPAFRIAWRVLRAGVSDLLDPLVHLVGCLNDNGVNVEIGHLFIDRLQRSDKGLHLIQRHSDRRLHIVLRFKLGTKV